MNIQETKQILQKSHLDMREICKIVFRSIPINILNFMRIDKSAQEITYLCDNYDWLFHYLNHDLYKLGAFETNQRLWQPDWVLWNAFENNDPIVEFSRCRFNIYTGVTLIKKFGAYTDFFNFGTDQQEAQDYLLKYQEKLDEFINIFYHKAKKLIASATNIQLIASSPLTKPSLYLDKIKNVYLGSKYDYAYLTPKEQEIIVYLSKGLNSIDIGKLQQCSFRTIEKHLENVKRKFNCQTLFELGFELNQIIKSLRGSAYSNNIN